MKTPRTDLSLLAAGKLIMKLPCLLVLLAVVIGMMPTARAVENELRTRRSSSAVSGSQVQWTTKRPPEQAPRKSLLAQAAEGTVQQTGFFHGGCNSCGPVCDCCEPSCGLEIACGAEPSYGYEVGCGVETIGPGCGSEPLFHGGPTCGIESIPCNGCGDYCDGGCDAACSVQAFPIFLPLIRIEWRQFEFFAGTQGFKGPLSFANTDGANGNNRVGSGSFGFYEGFNHGRSLRWLLGSDLSWQFGLRATQSNLSGAEFTNENRKQIFLTTGFFRRVDYGLQYGLALDYVNEDWYFQSDLTQLRGEVSWADQGCHVWGMQFMAGHGSETASTVVQNAAGATVRSNITFEPTDQYRLFYRRLLNNAGSWEAFAGWTDRDDGLLGASLNLPLRQNLAFQAGTTYLIPNEGSSNFGNQEESWNIGVGLVYRPGGPMGPGRYNRPMFDVADNGTFMVDRR